MSFVDFICVHLPFATRRQNSHQYPRLGPGSRPSPTPLSGIRDYTGVHLSQTVVPISSPSEVRVRYRSSPTQLGFCLFDARPDCPYLTYPNLDSRGPTHRETSSIRPSTPSPLPGPRSTSVPVPNHLLKPRRCRLWFCPKLYGLCLSLFLRSLRSPVVYGSLPVYLPSGYLQARSEVLREFGR